MTIQELEQCIYDHGKDIYNFCLQLTRCKEEADELYQDTFLKATEQMIRIQSNGNPKSYLISVALRIWKNKKRKSAWRSRIIPTDVYNHEMMQIADETADTLERLVQKNESELVQEAVSHLEDRYRIPILLYYGEQCSVKEISKLLSLPQGTVKSRLHYARKQLETELEDYFDEKT